MAKKKIDADNFMLQVDSGLGTPQRGLFKKKRSGEVLTQEQVAAIRFGRKKLRKELKDRDIKDRKEFELAASTMGLYFDKNRVWTLLRWFLHGKGLAMLLATLTMLLAVLFIYATISQLRGHFTINMSDGMFREGFVLSETIGFEDPTTHLFCEPAVDVPCISISHIPDDVDSYDGQHNANYFAYTFYLRNEGESTVGYQWSLSLNSESLQVSDAVWVMIFEDGEMTFYAKPDANGELQALPAYDDNSRGYVRPPLYKFCRDQELQYEIISSKHGLDFYRVIPQPYVTDTMVAQGTRDSVEPGEVHKYTVVIWLEGDDPDCTDELIGGHVGMEIYMQLLSEHTDADQGAESWWDHWDDLWDSLKFWED